MCRSSIWKELIARAMTAVMLVLSMPLGVAQAGMVATERVIDQVTADRDRARVMELLAREDVRLQLETLGIDADEASARAGSLSDAEIMQIAGQIDELPAGQNAASAILTAALLIFLVLLITDLLGLTNVYPFVRAQL